MKGLEDDGHYLWAKIKRRARVLTIDHTVCVVLGVLIRVEKRRSHEKTHFPDQDRCPSPPHKYDGE